MQTIDFSNYRNTQAYWNACLKQAELEFKERQLNEARTARREQAELAEKRLSLDARRFEAEQENIQAQIFAQKNAAQTRAQADVEVAHLNARANVATAEINAGANVMVAGIQAEADMAVAATNAYSAITVAETNAHSAILQEVLRGNAALAVEQARGRNTSFAIAENAIFSFIGQLNVARINEVAEENRHRREKELLYLTTKGNFELEKLKANLTSVQRVLEHELNKDYLEFSKKCELIHGLVSKALDLRTEDFSEDEIREAVNKMMRETEPYTGY